MEGLLEDAKKYELQKLENNKTMLLELSALEILLNDVYETHRPSSQDYVDRSNLIRIFNDIAREIYGNDDKCPVVKEFGSYLMELFDAGCDLDLSINFHDNKENADRSVQVKTLRKFANKLFKLQRSRHVSDVQLILSARVPVLKVTDSGTRVECDLSVGNLDGIVKSQFVRMISDIDERFRKLCVLMKVWAKANDINSAKDGTINSLSLILLVAFHLQTRDIPILPPFSAILKDGLDPAAVNKNIQDFLKYGESNKESLAELFVSILIKLESVNPLWSSGLCVSTYEGSWILKKLGSISIEDFADRSQNTCRALKRKNKGTVFSCIQDSIKQIRLFSEKKIDAIELKNLLFQAKPKAKSEVVVKASNKHELPRLIHSFTRKGKRKRQAERALQQSEEKLGGPKQTCPGNIKAPALPNVGRVGTSNVCSTSYRGIGKSQEILLGVYNHLLLAANTFQGSGGVRPESSLISPAGQQICMSNPPVLGYGGIQPHGPRGWTYRHTAPSFMPGHLRSTGYIPERSQVDHFSGAPNFSDPANYSWASRPSILMSPHQPHFPPAPDLFPSVPAQFERNSYVPGNGEISGHPSYQPHGNRPRLHFPRF